MADVIYYVIKRDQTVVYKVTKKSYLQLYLAFIYLLQKCEVLLEKLVIWDEEWEKVGSN